MSLVNDLVEHYRELIERGELKPEDVPTFRMIMAEWEVSRATAQSARTLLIRAGIAEPQIARHRPLGPITDVDYAFRFLPNVLPRNADGCLLWDAGTRGKGGYGRFDLNGQDVAAHRVAWEYRNGPVPEGLELDHVFARGCRSKLCVNHEHLEPVTHQENVLRERAVARWRAGTGVLTELDDD